MEFSEMQILLHATAKRRAQLKQQPTIELEKLRENLQDALDYLYELTDTFERRVGKLEEVIDDLEPDFDDE